MCPETLPHLRRPQQCALALTPLVAVLSLTHQAEVFPANPKLPPNCSLTREPQGAAAAPSLPRAAAGFCQDRTGPDREAVTFSGAPTHDTNDMC